MIIVSNFWKDLAQGYKRVLELNSKLPEHERDSADLINIWKQRLYFSPHSYGIHQTSPKPTSMSLREDIPIRKIGDRGENQLISSLAASLDDSFYAFHGLLLSNHLDVDVIVIGKTGIWVLESKDWSGYIKVRGGYWYRQKWGAGLSKYGSKQDSYGLPQHEEKIKAFDKQWLREKAEIEKVIRTKITNKTSNYSLLIRGGLVFTNSRVELDFDETCRAEYGNVQEWTQNIMYSTAFQELNEGTIIYIMDGLLKRSLFLRRQEGYSSLSIAEQLYWEILDTFK